MRRIWALIVLAAVVVSSSAFGEVARHSVEYYYRNYCESCTPEEDFALTFYALTGLNIDDCVFVAHNAATKSGYAAYAEAAKKYALQTEILPLAIVDGVPYAGAEQMNEGLPAASADWGLETDSVIIYLYTPSCENCARAKNALNALPKTVLLTRGDARIESAVVVRSVDISADPEYARRLFDAYDVPDKKRLAPSVFFADRYLAGIEDIEKHLQDMVLLGWASGGVKVSAADSADTGRDLTLLGAMAAGIVAGLNTCALSMFMLFLSIALQTGRRAGILSACFLLSKFVCYLLIGFFLLRVMQRLDPGWFRPVARAVMTALGAVIIVANLYDFLQAQRQRYGKIRNQLPAPLRARLSAAIKRASVGKFVIPSVIALGLIVALGEFLCAGQIYLMQILGAARTGLNGAGMLIVYCAAFILPSCALCGVVLRFRSQARVSALILANMKWVKLISSAVMLAFIAAAWL